MPIYINVRIHRLWIVASIILSILVEMLTQEVFKAEKKAYEKVIRMIAHEVNNTTARYYFHIGHA